MKTPYYVLLLLCAQSAFSQHDRMKYPYSDGHHWGVTNENKEVVVSPQFDTSFYFQRTGYAIVRKGGKLGVIDTAGKTRVECRYDELEERLQNIGVGRLGGKEYLVSFLSGKPLSPLVFDKVESFYSSASNMVIVSMNKKQYFLNLNTGQPFWKQGYDKADFFGAFEDRAIVMNGGKYGVMNLKTGALVVPVQYDETEAEYIDGARLIKLTKDKTVSYVDKDGKAAKKEKAQMEALEDVAMGVVEAPTRGDDGDSWNNDIYTYKTGDDAWKVTIENRRNGGTKIVKTTELKGYTALKKLNFNQNYSLGTPRYSISLLAVKDGKMGIIDWDGKTMVPFKYDLIEKDNRNNCIRIEVEGRVGVLDYELHVIKPTVLARLVKEDYNYSAWLVQMPGGQMGYMNKRSGTIYIPGIVD